MQQLVRFYSRLGRAVGGYFATSRGSIDAIKKSADRSWFNVDFNGVRIQLPGYTLKTMHHCISHGPEHGIKILLETRHWSALLAKLTNRSIFLDIGAATGAMTVPFSVALPDTRIVAFEPSHRARRFLEAALRRNFCSHPTVLPYALSDRGGRFTFIEYPLNDATPYLPEGSHLKASPADAAIATKTYPGTTLYAVEVRTLDSFDQALDLRSAENIVIKIDVEGFECHVLRGAEQTIRRYRPFMSIDIHSRIDGDGTTEPGVRSILGPSYEFERLGHALICRPT